MPGAATRPSEAALVSAEYFGVLESPGGNPAGRFRLGFHR